MNPALEKQLFVLLNFLRLKDIPKRPLQCFSADSALREMDWENARTGDVHDDGKHMCLEFGVRERGDH